jgi:N-acetylglucosamine-6-phosphate deacetylase
MICSGFLDLQVNGFAGVDFNDPAMTAADFALAAQAILRTGVTRFLPTVITASPDAIAACLRNLQTAARLLPRPGMVAGFHIEGPHIGPEDGPRGAHPAAWVRPPSRDEFLSWQEAANGRIRLITLSPHWREAARYIEWVVKQGVAVSIGHTSATPGQISDAASAGATLSTHLGNAAPATIDRRSNLFWTQLADDRLGASFIVDGFHLDDSFFRTALRAKGPSRSVLVTDASAPAGAVPGSYKLGFQDVDLLADGRIVLRGTQKLAGSALRMNEAIANAIRLGGVTLEEAIAMATVNPRRIIGLADSGDKVTFRHTNTGIEIDDVLIGAPLQ